MIGRELAHPSREEKLGEGRMDVSQIASSRVKGSPSLNAAS
jgi:hypothetical protein